MIGRTISHYKILEKLGEGGMGVVYKAQDTKLKRIVALKFLTPKALGNEEEKSRFVHEAQAAAALDHPHICTIHEIDEANGQTFIAMAYIEGESLKDKIASGPLKLNESLDIAIQVAAGLQEAHDKGIVHRDIKSGNIMVTSKGQAKIMDFGLAKLTGHVQITKTGTTMGTVAYMSPEQAQGEEVDHRSDIWSLGVVLYEMLAGQLPFRSEYQQAMVYSILNEEPEPATGLRTGMPMDLERIVNKALAKNLDGRYQRTKDILFDLRSVRKELKSIISEKRSSAKKLQRSIAVLPFTNLSADKEQDHFCDGMAEEIINSLTHLEGLRVVARTSAFSFRHCATGKRC
jgi:serine/threonine protein kinase